MKMVCIWAAFHIPFISVSFITILSVALAKRGQCYEGLGLYYGGTMSQTESGRTCEEWDSATRERYLASDINAGRHNYCR